MKVNTLFRRLPRLAENSGDYPIPVADAAELLDELRAPMPRPGPGLAPFGHRIDLEDCPSYCCARCEHLADRIREYGGVAAMDEDMAAWFGKQLEAIHR